MAQRIVTGLILAAMAAVIVYFGGLTMGIVVMFALMIAVHEEVKALRTAGHQVVAWPTYAISAVGLPVIVFLGDKSVMPMVLLACLTTIVVIVFCSEQPTLTNVLMSTLPLFSIVLPCMGMMCVSRILPVALQRTLMSMIFVVPLMGDMVAFFVGSKLRGPKLCPKVSPNKTISGAIGGLIGSVLGAVAVGAIAYAICPDLLTAQAADGAIQAADAAQRVLPGWGVIVLIGLLGGLAGQMGDLFASMVKRHAGIKDFSNLFPGHGGMLDRIDSIMFMALVIYSIRLLV